MAWGGHISFSLFLMSFLFWAVAPWAPVHALQVSPPKQSFIANPGDVIHTTLRILGTGGDQEYFSLKIEAFRKMGEENEREFYVPNPGDLNIANWIVTDVGTPQTVLHGEWKEFPIQINIPPNAPPGGHYGSVIAVIHESPTSSTSEVGTQSKVVGQLLLTVRGDIQEVLRVSSFQTLENQRLFGHLPVEFLTRLANQGNVHIVPKGFVEVFPLWNPERKVATLKFNDKELETFPESIRRYHNTWLADPPFVLPEGERWHQQFLRHALYELQHPHIGLYIARLGIVYGPQRSMSLQARTWFIVFPWHLVLLIVGVLLTYWVIQKGRRAMVRQIRRRWSSAAIVLCLLGTLSWLAVSPVSAVGGLVVSPAKQSVVTQTNQETVIRLEVRNLDAETKFLKVVLQDVSGVSSVGVPSFKEATDSAVGAWMSSVSLKGSTDVVPVKLTDPNQEWSLAAGATKQLEVKIIPPSTLPTANYPLAVFVEGGAAKPDNAQVKLIQRVAGLVSLTLTDRPIHKGLQVKLGRWHFVTQPVTGWSLPLLLKNTGTVHQVVLGKAWIDWQKGGKEVGKVFLNPEEHWLLPEQVSTVEMTDAALHPWSVQFGEVTVKASVDGEPFLQSYPVYFIGSWIWRSVIGLVVVTLLVVVGLAMYFHKSRLFHKQIKD